MDGPRDDHTKSESERQILYDIRITDVENSLGVTKGTEGRGGVDQEFGISRCKLVYTAWENNKVLLYNTGDCIQ